MTVAAMLDTLTTEEYLRWNAYFADRERERQRAENRARGVIDFTDPQGPEQLVSMVHAAGG
jgi:hypothetical protein